MPRRRTTALARYELAHPRDVAELEAQRVVKKRLSLIDEAERLHKIMMEHPDDAKRLEYAKLNKADFDDEAEEGDVVDDRVLAAKLAREVAEDAGNTLIAETPLKKLRQALNRAKSRFNQGTAQRQRLRLIKPVVEDDDEEAA
jgi:sugar-specific transcriptional regulator TrmB